MNIKSSTSSDSDLEAKIRLKPIKKSSFSNKNFCVICNETRNLFTSKESSKKIFIDSTKIRMDISKEQDPNLMHIFSNFDTLVQRDFLQWHKNCYKSYTSSKNITSYKKKFAKLSDSSASLLPQAVEASKPLLRKTDFDINKCVFCQKRVRDQKLCQVMTDNMENKIKYIAKHNSVLLSRIGVSDLIAIELKYHASCLTTELRKVTKMTLPNIEDCGWEIENGIIVPILPTEKTLPEGLDILSSCGCKTGCKNISCSCRKSELFCIGSCKCLAICSNKFQGNTPEHSQERMTYSHEEDSDSD